MAQDDVDRLTPEPGLAVDEVDVAELAVDRVHVVCPEARHDARGGVLGARLVDDGDHLCVRADRRPADSQQVVDENPQRVDPGEPDSVANPPNAADCFSRSLFIVVVMRPPIALVRFSSITR